MNIWPRMSGKSTIAILEAAKSEGVLMTGSMSYAMAYYRLARKMGLNPQFPKLWKGNFLINFAAKEATL